MHMHMNMQMWHHCFRITGLRSKIRSRLILVAEIEDPGGLQGLSGCPTQGGGACQVTSPILNEWNFLNSHSGTTELLVSKCLPLRKMDKMYDRWVKRPE